MKKTGIMTDSHSGILNEEAERLGIKVLPMPFYIGEKVYREGVDLSRDEFYDMKKSYIFLSAVDLAAPVCQHRQWQMKKNLPEKFL